MVGLISAQPDLKKAWAELGVNGKKLAYSPPDPDFQGQPHLTVEMVALLQGFPQDWIFTGKKTPAYRQVGNAFPPPVAQALGQEIIQCLHASSVSKQTLTTIG